MKLSTQPAIKLHTFQTPQAQAQALTQAIGTTLQAVLAKRERACLAVSGGNSPTLFLQTLSMSELAWPRIDITLVDERWVDENHTASNAALVRGTLLQNKAQAAHFIPLVDLNCEPSLHLRQLNADKLLIHLPDVAVLGMGEDGHTASLFADTPEWEQALITQQRLLLLHPQLAPYQRISWSFAALAQMGQLFLWITGERKLAVLQEALEQPLDNAISKLIHDFKVTLNVYWCAAQNNDA